MYPDYDLPVLHGQAHRALTPGHPGSRVWARLGRPGTVVGIGAWSIGAAALALVLAGSPGTAARFMALFLVAVAILLAPTYLAGAAMLIGTAVVPTVVIAASQGASSSLATAAFAGQARWTIVLLAFVLARAALGEGSVAIPRVAVLALMAAVTGYLFSALLGVLEGHSSAGSVSDLSRALTAPFAMLVAVAAARDAARRGRTATFHRGLALSALAIGLSCLLYWADLKGLHMSGPLRGSISRAEGFSGYHDRSIYPFVADSPNLGAVAYAMLAAVTVPPLLALRRRDRALGLITFVVLAAAVLTTQSRTGLACLAAGLLVYGWLRLRYTRLSPPVVWLTLLVGLVIAAGVYSTLPSSTTPISTSVQSRSLTLSTETFRLRESIWQQAASAIAQNPFGHGFEYSVNGPFFQSAAEGGAVAAKRQSVHEEVLAQLVDGGLVGLALFGIVAGSMIKVARDRDIVPFGRRTSFITLLVVAVTAMVASTVSQSAVCATLVWFGFGLAVAAYPVAGSADRHRRPEVAGAILGPDRLRSSSEVPITH